MRPAAWKVVLAHAALLIITVATLYPVLWVVNMALTPSQAFSAGVLPIPSSPTLANFRDVVGTTDASGGWLFGRQLLNSLIVASATAEIAGSLA